MVDVVRPLDKPTEPWALDPMSALVGALLGAVAGGVTGYLIHGSNDGDE